MCSREASTHPTPEPNESITQSGQCNLKQQLPPPGDQFLAGAVHVRPHARPNVRPNVRPKVRAHNCAHNCAP